MELELKKIDLEQENQSVSRMRPELFDDFIGQKEIKKILTTAVSSSQKKGHTLWHILFSGPSWFGKTTMAQIVAKALGVTIKIVTGYALSKPADLISVLNSLQSNDILFIDEIHRLKPQLEEILYIAMEDFALDMVMPEGWNVRIPLQPFTLIGATTKMEQLSDPFKNRFVYKFHFMDYLLEEKTQIVERYLMLYGVKYETNIVDLIVQKVDSVPREIHNFCVKVRDYLTVHHKDLNFSIGFWPLFESWVAIGDGGLTHLHQKYLEIVKAAQSPVGIKTLAIKLGINEQSVEQDIEPLLFKLGKIDKTARGRVWIHDE